MNFVTKIQILIKIELSSKHCQKNKIFTKLLIVGNSHGMNYDAFPIQSHWIPRNLRIVQCFVLTQTSPKMCSTMGGKYRCNFLAFDRCQLIFHILCLRMGQKEDLAISILEKPKIHK